VRNEEMLQRVKQERNIMRIKSGRKGNWTGDIPRRNCLLRHVNEGKIGGMIQVMGR
jgi:hypothetical protein